MLYVLGSIDYTRIIIRRLRGQPIDWSTFSVASKLRAIIRRPRRVSTFSREGFTSTAVGWWLWAMSVVYCHTWYQVMHNPYLVRRSVVAEGQQDTPGRIKVKRAILKYDLI